jgi:predicted AlkP superfamily pyrophosphatase or phosphodiesterase
MRAATFGLLAFLVPMAASAHPVLMISIDGLRSKDVIDAPARGLNLPHLRAMMTQGTYADGVRDMLPSITYPNHTTLVTGVAPALHGIASNPTFDPTGKDLDSWYWYAQDVKVPSLFDAVHGAGKVTLSFGWPVTTGSLSITDNEPEYWRAYTPNDIKVIRAVSTPGLAERITALTGIPFAQTVGVTVAADAARAKAAAALIAADHPHFSALHLSSLDETEHQTGPGTPESHANLEALDTTVGELVAAARKAEPDLVVALVSDHGFAPISHEMNLGVAFAEAGLMTVENGKVTSWLAAPWYAAGSSLIILANPEDMAVKAKVRALLAKLESDPRNGIAAVIDRADIAQRGGAKDADFWVNYAPGYKAGKALTGALVTPSTEKGTHGYFPEWDAMRSTFLITGPGIAHGKNLGEIDMRDIAPTVAKILDVKLPTATGKPLF